MRVTRGARVHDSALLRNEGKEYSRPTIIAIAARVGARRPFTQPTDARRSLGAFSRHAHPDFSSSRPLSSQELAVFAQGQMRDGSEKRIARSFR